MAQPKKQYKLDLTTVLQAIDGQDMTFYNRLSDEEKKSYTPLVLMRYMSSLTDQSKYGAYAVIATNDIVNIGFWELSKYPDLQHKMLCLAGLGGKQYRPWVATKRSKIYSSKTNQWVSDQFPELNNDEIELLKSQYSTEQWETLLKGAGLNDSELKVLLDDWKKSQP
jgi:hypothetical protein